MDWRQQVAQYQRALQGEGQGQPKNSQFGGGYLSQGQFDTSNPNISWEDFTRQLMFSQLDNVTDFNSPMYQQYRGMLQKTTPGMGLNTLLGMAMSSGTGYAGGQGIANQKSMQFNKQRNDSINNGVGQFTTNMQSQAQGLLGQIGGSFAATADRKFAQEQADAASSPWGAIGQGLGGLVGLIPGLSGVGSKITGAMGGSGTAGYRPQPSQWNNPGFPNNYNGG